jgi:formate dehydrogenase maturation protein FdhE
MTIYSLGETFTKDKIICCEMIIAVDSMPTHDMHDRITGLNMVNQATKGYCPVCGENISYARINEEIRKEFEDYVRNNYDPKMVPERAEPWRIPKIPFGR